MEAAVQVQNDLGEEWDRQTILYLPYLMPQDTRILVQKSFRPVSLVCLRASFCLYRIYRVSARTCRRTKSGSLKSDIHLDQGKNIRKPHGAWCRNCFQEPFSLNTAANLYQTVWHITFIPADFHTTPHPSLSTPRSRCTSERGSRMPPWAHGPELIGLNKGFLMSSASIQTVGMQSFGSNFGSSSAIASRIGHLSNSNTTWQ